MSSHLTARSVRRVSFVLVLVLVLVLALPLLTACGSPAEALVDPAIAPSGPTFRPVAQLLVDRCGSLDCHGSSYRNLRLYGFGSARLGPGAPDGPETTQAEVDQDYEAIVSVEPEVFRQVVSEGGREPERLTFIRKARNEEAHGGGQRIVAGEAADECLLGWLRGAVDAKVCLSAIPRLAEP